MEKSGPSPTAKAREASLLLSCELIEVLETVESGVSISPEELDTELGSGQVIFWVAEQNREIIAVAGTRPAPKHLGGDLSLELYIIATKKQNEGTGTKLLQYVEKNIPEKYTEIVLYSPKTHRSSWKFYEKNGFKNCGVINDPEDGHPGIL